MINKHNEYKYLDQQLDAHHRTLLFHDGSMTKYLECLHGLPIAVQIVKVGNIGESKYLCDWTPFVKGDLCREVILRNENQQLVYARSVWNSVDYASFMAPNVEMAIGKNLINQKLPQYREILLVCDGEPLGLPTDKLMIYSRAYIIMNANFNIYIEEYFI